MALSELELHIGAYYISHGARELEMNPRFWPYAELVLIVEDKIMFAVRQFGITSTVTCRPVASALLDALIAGQGFSTTTGSLGEKAHRYQAAEFRKVIDQMLETDPIVQRAKSAGPDFWKDSFAALRGGR